MKLTVRSYEENDLREMMQIWNEVVEEGIAFPQEETLDIHTAKQFFASQTYSAAAVEEETNAVAGLYILHPNNVGRCGHICNASFAVRANMRGMRIGEQLVLDCLAQAKQHGFRILQFNAVVSTNVSARRLYERLGFIQLGTIPGGFRMRDGQYEDICPYYKNLE